MAVALIDPNTMFRIGLNQVRLPNRQAVEIRADKTTVSVDFYNMLNVSTILSQNSTFGPAWLQPSSIMPARFAKVSLQFDF